MIAIVLAAVLAAPATPLREIGHVRARTAFCSAFETHFNGAVRPLLVADERVGAIGFTLGTIETHYRGRGPELALYDDRVHLMRYVGDLQKLIPQARRELDDLRTSAALAGDPETAARARDAGVALGKALDKQRQIAIDSLGIVQAMMDLTTGTNRNESRATVVTSLNAIPTIDPLAHLDGIRDAGGPRASTEVTSVLPGAYDTYVRGTPANARDVRSYLKFSAQTDRIGDAESLAATLAAPIADRCDEATSSSP